MELHYPTADSGLTLIETPGSKSFTRPKSLEPAVLGEVHVVGEMTAVQVELLLQQALAIWQRNH